MKRPINVTVGSTNGTDRQTDRQTCDVVAVGGVDLFDATVAERQLPHPVDTATHARRQTQAGVTRRWVETVRHEIVIAVQHIPHTSRQVTGRATIPG